MQVRVFRNLHKGCLSVECAEKGHPLKNKVIAYANSVYLRNVWFSVSEPSRQRVLASKSKNVHARVCGTLELLDLISYRYDDLSFPQGCPDHDHPIAARYNPYEKGFFFLRETGEELVSSECALIQPNGVFLEPNGFILAVA